MDAGNYSKPLRVSGGWANEKSGTLSYGYYFKGQSITWLLYAHDWLMQEAVDAPNKGQCKS
jgi:hypothetical protein